MAYHGNASTVLLATLMHTYQWGLTLAVLTAVEVFHGLPSVQSLQEVLVEFVEELHVQPRPLVDGDWNQMSLGRF